MKINEIIIAPVLTEKATKLVKYQVYMFSVSPKAGKAQISEALEGLYNVKVKSVRTMTKKGKEVRRGRKMTAKKLSDQKVAFVRLKEGKLDLFPQT